MKLVVLTKAMPAANALVSALQEVATVTAVICEGGAHRPQAGLLTRIRARRPLERRRHLAALRSVFGTRLHLAEAPVVHGIAHRQWDEAIERLQADPPDLIVVFGTSLIPGALAELASIATINIHTGLAPHYRGLYCTQFAILNDDVGNVGVTIHRVSARIDGGEIAAQARPRVELGDDDRILELRAQRAGHELACGLVRRVLGGEAITWVPQPPGGTLYRGRDWTTERAQALRRRIRDGLIDEHVRRAARGEVRGHPLLGAP